MKILLSGFLLILLISLCSGINENPIKYIIQDIPYNPDTNAVIDFYYPNCDSNSAPIVLWAHGGSFNAGKEDIDTQREPFSSFLRNCMAIGAIRYTLAPIANFVTSPSQPSDLGRAVQFFKLNASDYNINSGKIIAFGSSSGSEIWSYIVYGPDMVDSNNSDPLKRESSRPNLFINHIGASYWRDYDQIFIPATYFGKTKLSQVSDQNQLNASASYWINQPNAIIIPVFSIVKGNPTNGPPIKKLHDPWFAFSLDANIHAIDINNPSIIHTEGIDDLNVLSLINWIQENS